jgi:hypothetical protein
MEGAQGVKETTAVNQADPVQRRAPDFFLVGAPKSATRTTGRSSPGGPS